MTDKIQEINQNNQNDDIDNDYDEAVYIDSSEDDDEVPHEWMFQSYMAYVMWGPFAKKEKKLQLQLYTDGYS